MNWRSSALAVACPKCGAHPGAPCRAVVSGRSTDTHIARFEAWMAQPRGGAA